MNKFLQELQTFDLSPDKIENIISKGKLLHVKNQSLLIKRNMVCDKVYFVLKGGFVCRYIDEELEIEKAYPLNDGDIIKLANTTFIFKCSEIIEKH
jgi:hypothetical protein